MNIYHYSLIAIFLIMASACGDDKSAVNKDSPTSGKKTIIADNAFENTIMDSEALVFHEHYPDATIQIKYAPEADVVNTLLKDSIQGAILCRPLSEAEKQHFIDRRFEAREDIVAVDALAFIVNTANNDTVLTMSDVLNLVHGDTPHWSNLSDRCSISGDVQLILDNEKSSIARYLKDTLNQGKALPAYVSAVKSNDEVIDYVSKNKNAIGIINVSRVSNPDDSTQMSFLKKVHVCYYADDNHKIYQPIAAAVALKKYPFTRKVYYINCEPYDGVVTGFAAWLRGDIGQIIVKRAGMMPGNVNLTVRQVQVNKSF